MVSYRGVRDRHLVTSAETEVSSGRSPRRGDRPPIAHHGRTAHLADVTSSLGKVPRHGGGSAGSAGPVPAIRWSVSSASSPELTDQGIRRIGGKTRRRLEAMPQAVVWTADRPRGAGVYPIFTSALVVVCSGRSSMRPDRQSGGDEETRTPDPLLAKEMLSQLSYVPRTLRPAGRWWAFLDSNQRPLPYQGSALTS